MHGLNTRKPNALINNLFGTNARSCFRIPVQQLLAGIFILLSVTGFGQEINLVKGISTEKIEKLNLGKNINSGYSEYVPVISPDGQTLYLFVLDDPQNFGEGDIWYSNKSGTDWSPRKNIGEPLNNEANNFVISVSPDNNTLFLSRRYKTKGNKVLDNGQGFSLSRRTTKGWSVPVDVLVDNFKNKSKYGEFCMSADQKTLLHAIETNESFGNQDLYVSFRKPDGSWTEPKNLGKRINTSGSENSPFLAADGTTLYFATDGRPGYGQADIFMSRRLDDSWTNWSEPENLGPSINSSAVDAYFTIPASGDYVYLVSGKNSLGGADIWKLKLPEALKPKPVVLVYGKVLNSTTNEPIQANITYRLLETDEEVGIASSSPVDGTYKIILPAGKIYSFMAIKENIYTESQNIDLKDIKEYKEIERNLYLAPIQVGSRVIMHNLFFVTGKSEINPWSHPELGRLIDLMKRHKTLEIEIAGHTDNVGSDKVNDALSLERANAVKDYLAGMGVESSRLHAKGYGKSKPISPNTTEEGKRKNRRVDFTILKL
jgi:outer membrane protein OmpA-like peptidoglycan-associated protein